MAVTADAMLTYLQKLLGVSEGAPKLPLEDYVSAAPSITDLADVPRGTVVLIRGDVDAKVGANVGDGDIRLRSMVETLEFGRKNGWIQVIFGHIGRKPEGSLNKVAERLGLLLNHEATLIKDWWDDAAGDVTKEATDAIAAAKPGDLIVLENTRKYDIERVLWKAGADDLPGLADKLAAYANTLAQKIGSVYIHEAFSAGSLDSSSVVAPAGMDRIAVGSYELGQFTGPMMDCRQADVVVFSGLKIDKLDDLEAIVARGKVTTVIAAGSLAMSLKKAAAQLDGGDFNLGLSQDPAHSDKPYFIAEDRVQQAKALIEHGRKNGITFVLPVDFVLADGTVVDKLGPTDQQFDIGPKTSEVFEKAIGEIIAQSEKQVAAGEGPMIVFHNGVFGKFEDAIYERGTKHFIGQLKRLHDAGVKVYIGGGEGGEAAARYGNIETDITHCFTAGGTVLNALGSQPIPYLQAIYLLTKHK